MACDKHGPLSGPAELCPVCLLEQALEPASRARLIIQVPLGRAPTTSVFLVAQDAPSAALLRLKVWRRPRARVAFSTAGGAGEPPRGRGRTGDRRRRWRRASMPTVSGRAQRVSAGAADPPGVRSGALASAAALVLLESLAPRSTDAIARDSRTARSCPATCWCDRTARAAFLRGFRPCPLFRGTSPPAAAAAARGSPRSQRTRRQPLRTRSLERRPGFRSRHVTSCRRFLKYLLNAHVDRASPHARFRRTP